MTKGRNSPAVRLKATATSADTDALFEQAMAHYRQGRHLPAAAICRRILVGDPGHPDALQVLGIIEFQSGRFASAAALLQKAVATAPAAAGLHGNLGLALQQLGRLDQALACHQRALALRPDFAEAHNNRGNVLLEMRRTDEALACYRRAVQFKPDFAEAHYNLGRLLLERKQAQSALDCLARCLQLAPQHAAAMTQCGIALMALQRPREALAALERALPMEPNDGEAHFWRGNALLRLDRPRDALAAYARAAELLLDVAEAHYNLGTVLLDLDRPEPALHALERTLQLRPDYVEAWYNRGGALQDLRRHPQAADNFRRLLEIVSSHRYARGMLFHSHQYCCDWTHYARDVAALTDAAAVGATQDRPFPFLAVTSDPALQLACARAYTGNNHPPAVEVPTPRTPRSDRLRVAYVSADFREHPVSYLLAGVFEGHDSEDFEVVAVALRPFDDSAIGRRVATAFEHAIDVSGMTDAEAAARIRELDVDIAVDLNGYTENNRTDIFARRAAPIQVNYLGFPGTMGADYIDYIIADEFVIPEHALPHYAESVVWLPGCFQGNDHRRAASARPPSRAAVGLPERGFVFCAFNNLYKFTPPLFDTWMRLLRQVEGSVLWIAADDEEVRRNLAAEAAARGVDARRLVFAPRVNYPDHLARLEFADLFLDTLPFNAGTTASDCLWVGLPLVTCAGEAFAARMAGSLLHALGLPELVTRSLDDYEALTLKLATTPVLLADLRARLWSNRTTSPLFDTKQFCRHLEAAYRSMWERQQRGEPPADFRVAPDFTNRCGIDS